MVYFPSSLAKNSANAPSSESAAAASKEMSDADKEMLGKFAEKSGSKPDDVQWAPVGRQNLLASMQTLFDECAAAAAADDDDSIAGTAAAKQSD